MPPPSPVVPLHDRNLGSGPEARYFGPMQGERASAPTSPVSDPHDEPWIHRYAAILAASPAIAVGLELLGIDTNWLPIAVPISVGVIVLAILDARVLRRLGHQVTWLWILVPLPVVYLIHRTKHSRGPVAIPWIWGGAVAIAVVFTALTYEEEPYTGFPVDSYDVQVAIQDDYMDQGRGPLTVRCPLFLSGEPGDLVECNVSEGRDVWTIEVRLDGPDSWDWHEVG